MTGNPFNIFGNLFNKAYEEKMNGKGIGTALYNGLFDSAETAAKGYGQQMLPDVAGVFKGNAKPSEMLNPIAQYQDYLKQNGYADNVVNGVSQGLNSGDKDIADWINQYNNGADGQKNPIRIPKTAEEIELAKQGQFNVPTQVGGLTANTTNNKNFIDSLASGLGDFQKGFQENKENAFKPENMISDDSKSTMNKIGEGVGTVARVLEKPATQAIIAGTLSAMNGNGIVPAIADGYKMGTQRARSNMYQDALRKNGVDIDTGVLGNITSNDMNALLTPQYKEADRKLAEAKLNQQILYQNALMDRYQKELEEKVRHNQETEKTNQTRANASVIRANKVGTGKTPTTKTPKPQEHKDWGNDLAGYSQRLTDPRYSSQIPNMKAKFIQKYGVDPDKYIKL